MPYDGARGDVLDPLAVWGFGPLKGGPSASLGIEPRRCAQQRSLSDCITDTVFERGDRMALLPGRCGGSPPYQRASQRPTAKPAGRLAKHKMSRSNFMG